MQLDNPTTVKDGEISCLCHQEIRAVHIKADWLTGWLIDWWSDWNVTHVLPFNSYMVQNWTHTTALTLLLWKPVVVGRLSIMSAAIFCSGWGPLIMAQLLSARTMRTPVCPTGTLNRDRFLFPAPYILSVCLQVSVLLPHPATHPSCIQTCCSPAEKATCLDLIGGGDAHCTAKVASFPLGVQAVPSKRTACCFFQTKSWTVKCQSEKKLTKLLNMFFFYPCSCVRPNICL